MSDESNCNNRDYCELKFQTLEDKMDAMIVSVSSLDKTLRNGITATMSELRSDINVNKQLHASHDRDSNRQWGTIAFLILTIVAAAIGLWFKP